LVEQAINGRLRRAKRKLAELLQRHGFDQAESLDDRERTG